MTSKQIMLILSLAWAMGMAIALPGCQTARRVETVTSPYASRQVFAVAPLRNESGSAYADGVRLADRLAAQFALTRGIEVLPVNRVLEAMDALGLERLSEPREAMLLRQTLGVDGLVVGSIVAYDPYRPMKLGLNLELYRGGSAQASGRIDPQALSRAATDDRAILPDEAAGSPSLASTADIRFGPTSALGGYYDAADPNVDDLLTAYAAERGPDGTSEMTRRRYGISFDLYSEFVSYQLTSRLMQAERLRLRQPGARTTADRPQPAAPPRVATPQAYGHSMRQP